MTEAPYAIKLLGPADASLLLNADPEIFDHPVDEHWAAEFLNDPRHHIVVAMARGHVIGSATATHYVHPDQPPSLFIIEVAVAPTHQRRGVAKAMLRALLAHGRTLGCNTAWVGTENSNAPAQRLYASAGGSLDPDAFVTFTFGLG